MARKLYKNTPDFDAQFASLLGSKREQSEDVDQSVREIIKNVRERGNAALIEYSLNFDHVDLQQMGLRIPKQDIIQARSKVDEVTLEALKLAARRIESHHERQLPKDDYYTDALGVELGSRWSAIQAVGLYVPGGTASYPSSVLMNAIPAKVAGASRIVMVVPTPRGEINPLVLVAAELAGIDEIYRIGGAQAIAALAYGTETIAPVSKIVGPGNAYVAAAKRQVFGTVGIDMIAGPSEILVVADGHNNPDWIAADLLAQAEHDVAAQSILVTNDEAFADAVIDALKRQLAVLPRGNIAAASWENFGAVIVVPGLEDVPSLVNQIAPEHLELAIDEPEVLLDQICNAGAVFMGRYTPEVIGDYVGGSNHVLPTARSAKFSSGLGVLDFMKRTSILHMNEQTLQALGPAAMALAKAEGLEGHSRSVGIRLEQGDAEGSEPI